MNQNNTTKINDYLPNVIEYMAILFINITITLFAILQTYGGVAFNFLFYFIVPSVVLSVIATFLKFKKRQSKNRIIKGNLIFYILNCISLFALVAGLSFLFVGIALNNISLYIVFGILIAVSAILFIIAILVNHRDDRADLFKSNRHFICFDICSAFCSIAILSFLFYIVFIENIFLIFCILTVIFAFVFFMVTIFFTQRKHEHLTLSEILQRLKFKGVFAFCVILTAIVIALSVVTIFLSNAIFALIACLLLIVAFVLYSISVFFNIHSDTSDA